MGSNDPFAEPQLGFAYAALNRIVRIDRAEVAASLWSFACFFFVLCGYYVLRPLRDEMGVQGGVENLPWLFSATFAVMLGAAPLFGWAAARLPRRRLVPWTYLFFVANVLVFYALFAAGAAPPAVARAFFVWVSVFNLFVVSLFWSLMVDLFHPEQAARLFGFVSAGGSCGALAGPTLTALLAAPLGTANLLLVSCGFLGLALVCSCAHPPGRCRRLRPHRPNPRRRGRFNRRHHLVGHRRDSPLALPPRHRRLRASLHRAVRLRLPRARPAGVCGLRRPRPAHRTLRPDGPRCQHNHPARPASRRREVRRKARRRCRACPAACARAGRLRRHRARASARGPDRVPDPAPRGRLCDRAAGARDALHRAQ